MISSAGQNWIVQFAKPDSPVFSDRTELNTKFFHTELNTKELNFQALIDISPPLSLSTQKVLGGLLDASLIIVVFVITFFNILWIYQRRRVNRRRVR
jgi:hypothetical protein